MSRLESFRQWPRKPEKALPESPIRYFYFLSELSKCKNLSFITIEKIRAHIVHLSFFICPAAIVWFIVAIIIYAINGHSIGSFSHVFQEQNIVVPTLTYFDSASAISFVIMVAFAVATFAYSFPDSIGPSLIGKAVRSGNSGDLLGGNLPFPAATGSANSSSKLVASDGAFHSAIALAGPEWLSRGIYMRKTNNGPAIELQSGKFLHGMDIMNKQIAEVNRKVYHGD